MLNLILKHKPATFGRTKYSFECQDELGSTKYALNLYANKEMGVEKLEFYSTLLGIAAWESRTNHFFVQKWEDEDTAKSQSSMSYHYTTSLVHSTEKKDEDMAKKIVTFVLGGLEKPALDKFVLNILAGSNSKFDPDELGFTTRTKK